MVSFVEARKIHAALTKSAQKILQERREEEIKKDQEEQARLVAEAERKKAQAKPVVEDDNPPAVDNNPTDDTDDDSDPNKEREKHIIMQLRAAQDIEAEEHPIKLKDGSVVKLKPSEVDSLLAQYEKKEKPVDKVAFVEQISTSPEHIVNYI